MSMQDRVEMYNTVLALEDEEEDMEQTQVRTRKSSKVNTSLYITYCNFISIL